MRPWVSIGDCQINITIEVPYFRGELSNLYQYIYTPWATEYFFLHIQPSLQYLVWDPEHRFVMEMNREMLRSCQSSGGIWHCASPILMLRQPADSCLYSLFHQNTQNIEKTCPVQVAPPGEVIVPIARNLFHLISYKPSTFIVECSDAVDPIRKSERKHVFINLTKTCLRAFTDKRIFLYQPLGETTNQILISNLTGPTQIWVNGLLSDTKEWIVSKLLDDLEELFDHPVPLSALKEKISSFIWDKVREVLSYVAEGGVPLTGLGGLGWLIRKCIRRYSRDPVRRENAVWMAEGIPLRAHPARLFQLDPR